LRDELLVEPRREADGRRSRLPRDGRPTALVPQPRRGGCEVVDGLEALVRQGAASSRALDRVAAPVRRDAAAPRLRRDPRRCSTAGESHGPALVAIVAGLPAGSCSTGRRSTPTSARRQQGYGRSPRQQIETDEVEVLAGLRHGRTLGTPLALVVRNRDHKNWTWGMSPWPPEGEPRARARSR
jgi:hypothetical protein